MAVASSWRYIPDTTPHSMILWGRLSAAGKRTQIGLLPIISIARVDYLRGSEVQWVLVERVHDCHGRDSSSEQSVAYHMSISCRVREAIEGQRPKGTR